MTSWVLLTLPTWLIAILVIGAPTLLAMCGVALVRRRVSWETLAEHNIVGVDIWARTGAIYGIFLAFVVVLAWQQLGHAQQVLAEEAATLRALYRTATGFTEPHRGRVQEAIRAYTRSIIDDEWPTMARGQESPRSQERFEMLWQSLLDFEPNTERETTAYGQAHALLPELSKQRAIRMRASEAAIPAVFWLVLLGGGAIVITFPLLFGIRNLRVQMLMVGMLAAMICAALFLAVVLDRPFTGDVRAEPTAFEEALRIMDPIMDPTPR
jgi:hypothetical protein